MLIDDALPHFDEVERHEIEITASPARTYLAVRRLDLSSSTLVRVLFALRGLPALISQPGRRAEPPALTLDDLLAAGFVLLAERSDVEIVLGLVGRFWTPTGDVQRLDAEGFARFQQPGFAKVAWNFALDPHGAGGTLLSTETRVRCLDDASRRRFRFYWFFIRPFSGLVRGEMLRAIKRSAELPLA